MESKVNIAWKKCSRQIYWRRNKHEAIWNIIKANGVQLSKTPASTLNANDFNCFFSTADNVIADTPAYHSNFRDFVQTDNNLKVNFRSVTYHEVRDTNKCMKTWKSKDPFEVNAKIMKTLINLILYPLTKFMNMCIENNVFTDCFKLVKGIPLFKNVNENETSNYRPKFKYVNISNPTIYFLKASLNIVPTNQRK